ncbi:MAG TPA: YibE/F family protein [Clostridiales bacterium]|nr:YibE/F family protein [Clostridiales bacterium]
MARRCSIKILFSILTCLLVVLPPLQAFGSSPAVPQQATRQVPYSRAKVLKVLGMEDNKILYSGGSLKTSQQLLEVQILTGTHKGKILEASYELNVNLNDKYKTVEIGEGDVVLLYLAEKADGTIEKAYVAEIARDKYLLMLVLLFFILLALIGKQKGLKAILSLSLTVLAVFKIILPAILKGSDPVSVSVKVCIAVIGVTLLIISGWNRKTLAAVIGTSGGVLIAGLLALITGSLAKLTGFGTEEAQMLMYIPQNVQLNFRGLLFAGIIIGTMGATMDIGMSIASAMNEIKANSPQIKTPALFKAGMNIGRDMMATMSNTLILAYAGGSLHLMLLLMAHNTPFSHIINWDMISTEVLRAIAGSIGIITAIPLTALASALIEDRY